MELARRLGIVETRAATILDQFNANKNEIIEFINTLFLSQGVKKLYVSGFNDNVKRIQ